MSRHRKVRSEINIGGQSLPVQSWRTTSGSDGTIGTFDATSSIAYLRAQGVDVVAASQTDSGASFDFYAGYDNNSELLFSGVMDECKWKWKLDIVVFNGRDNSATLADQKQVIPKINYKNQTVSQIAQQIADAYGMDADITKSDIKAGPEMYGENSFTPHPQTWWSVLQGLASQVGFDVHVTPDGKLHFGPPDSTGGDIEVSWMIKSADKPTNPLIDLETSYSPRNNADVEVKVISYHPQTTKKVTATATSKSRKVKSKRSSGKTTTVKATGQSGGKSAGTKPSRKNIHTFHMDAAMTEDAAKARAQSIADDIAKRQIIQTCEIEGLPELKVHSGLKIKVADDDLLGFENLDYVVNSVEHTYQFPTSSSGSGWTTHFTALGNIDN